MPFDLEQFGGAGTVSGYRIRLRGRFCFKEGLAIWESFQAGRLRTQIYYIDLADATELPEDGVAWLAMFLRWAEEAGVSVRLLNAKAEHAEWLEAVGITETGTALDPVRPARTRTAFHAELNAQVLDLGDVTLEQVAISSHCQADSALDGGSVAKTAK